MCVRNTYTDVRPDGHTPHTWTEIDSCKNIRAGLPCDGVQSLRHPPGYKRPEPRSPIIYGHGGQMPPTPPLSYHSDHTSDSERSSKRRSSIHIKDHKLDVSDLKPVDISRRRSLRHDRQASRDRGYLSSSPLSRTPPSHHHHGMPPSPIPDRYDVYEPTHREPSKHERPTSSYGHPAISIEITNSRSPSRHRHGSSSKSGSSHGSVDEGRRHSSSSKASSSHGSADEGRRQASSVKTSSSRGSVDEGRRQRRPSEVHHDDDYWQRKKESEIARQNEAIANRAPIPSTKPRYRRGSVSVPSGTSPTERARLEEEKAKRQRRKEAEEQDREVEALRQRLKDRMSFKTPTYV